MRSNDKELKQLSRVEYWENRYAMYATPEKNQQQDRDASKNNNKVEEYEWFRNFADLRPFLEVHLPAATSKCRILHLGCGTSV